MRELPQESNAGAPDAELISISNDLSVIRNSPEFKRFQATYKIDPLNLDPKLEPKRLLANAVAMQGAYVGEAEKACIAVGGFNKRITELQDDSNKAFEDYKHDEWIDFASNSLSVSGNVILYATGVGEVAQLGRAALKLKKLKDRARVYELHQIMAKFGNFPQVRVAQYMATVPRKLRRLNREMTRFSIATQWQALNTWGTMVGRVTLVVGQSTIKGFQGADLLHQTTSEFLLGGDVWKQFQGFVNPYEEMINLSLEQKKKWAGTYQTNHSQAQALKGKIEALMKKIVQMESQPAPPGIGYGGFTISREGAS